MDDNNENLLLFANVDFHGPLESTSTNNDEFSIKYNTIKSFENENADIHLACRIGDERRVLQLIQNGTDINERDFWDSVPLYYASLTGHTQIVKLLLAHGALCNEFTFDGARCRYGALNMEIRELLDNADVCKKKAPLKPLAKSLRTLCSVCDDPEQVIKEIPDLEDYSDIIIKSEDNEYYVHKAILSSRLPDIKKLIERAEMREERIKGKPFITFSPDFMNKKILEYVLIYVYSERIDIEMEVVEIFDKVMKRFGCHELNNLIKKELRSISYYFKALAKGTSPKRFVLYPPSYPESITLEESMQQLRLKSNLNPNYIKNDEIIDYVDIILKIADDDDNNHSFIKAHKCILCARSEYFRKLTSNQFIESIDDKLNVSLPVQKLPIIYHLPNLSYESTMLVMEYIYTNHISITNKQNIKDIDFISNVFDAADFLLVFEIKKIFGELIIKELQYDVDLNMICQLLWISDTYHVIILRDFCLNKMAILFNKIICNNANEFEIELYQKFILSAAPKTFTDPDSLFESDLIRHDNYGQFIDSKVASGIGIGSILQDLREHYLELFTEDKELREDYAQEFDKIFYDFTIKAKNKWTLSSN